jgi:hypothetical protein
MRVDTSRSLEEIEGPQNDAPSFASALVHTALQLRKKPLLVLALRFEDEMRATEIARMLHVHPAQITRTVKQAEVKFHEGVLTRLTAHHGLGEPAIEECIGQILSQGETSIAALLHVVEQKQSRPPVLNWPVRHRPFAPPPSGNDGQHTTDAGGSGLTDFE